MTPCSNNSDMLRKLLKQFGIEDDPRWLAIVLFVRNLVRDLSVFTSKDKADIQQDIFCELSAKDFSEERYDNVISKLDAFVTRNTQTAELQNELDAEKRSTEALLDEMHETIEALRHSGDRQEDKLQEAQKSTENAIHQAKDRDDIVAKVREQFSSLVAELREEASEWEARAKRLEHTAMFDPLLTELHNRRALDARLVETAERFRREATQVTLMMIDVDHFKPINDTHGHQVGDEVLKKLASIVSSQAILFDGFSARYGGEELAVLTEALTLNEAVFKAEVIKRDVEQARVIPHVKDYDGGELSFTVSIGVAAMAEGWQASDLVRAADKALYQAKENGRNLVIYYEEE
ncbi:GGDEF domain-containing protein [Salidesulfovibrio brasiliensis]|uniref:GGDEF domain-containing protein n=1 Tax=Salidesulfovibrio brasiliensis TaxID=221711 RepID=UPI0006D1047A|nr:GGDEF domain-containing protein [Salidesulfovibrio brasiliensis]